MKNLLTITLVFISLLCFGQSEQMIALKTGDTLTVTKLEMGINELIFITDGQKKGVQTADVLSYYVYDKWYDMITGKAMGSFDPDDVTQTSVLARHVSANVAAKNDYNRKFHINAAGSSLIIGTTLGVIMALVSTLVSNPDVALGLAIGSGVVFVGFQVAAGLHLQRASDY